MGWLRCEPDSMFRDHVFSAAGLASRLAPATVARLAAVGRQLPPALAAAIWKSSFVAAPMQLHALVRCARPTDSLNVQIPRLCRQSPHGMAA
jgi:hypothetical protein